MVLTLMIRENVHIHATSSNTTSTLDFLYSNCRIDCFITGMHFKTFRNASVEQAP